LPEGEHGRKEVRQSKRVSAYAGACKRTHAIAEIKAGAKCRGKRRGVTYSK
jgi:hypothetical protein